MEVYALVGPSGTGKSHRALLVAQQYGVDALIDDGLLIHNNRIVAGKSAKREPTKLQAIRRAIFVDPEQAQEVKEKLREVAPKRLLVISTSPKMIERIRERLELPPLTRLITIEEIASPLEITRAREIRRREGKHVIPVPTIEVKKKFPGLLVDPLEVFFPRRSGSRMKKIGEKSLVRPTFSYVGKLFIADVAITTLIHKFLEGVKGVRRPLKTQIQVRENEGVVINLELQVVYGYELRPLLSGVQGMIKERVEYYTGLHVLAVNVTARSMVVP